MKGKLPTVSKYIMADVLLYKKQLLIWEFLNLNSDLSEDTRTTPISCIYATVNLEAKIKRSKVYWEKIDFKNLDYYKIESIWTLYVCLIIKSYEEEHLVCHMKKLKRKHKIYFSTDVDISGKKVIEFNRTILQNRALQPWCKTIHHIVSLSRREIKENLISHSMINLLLSIWLRL